MSHTSIEYYLDLPPSEVAKLQQVALFMIVNYMGEKDEKNKQAVLSRTLQGKDPLDCMRFFLALALISKTKRDGQSFDLLEALVAHPAGMVALREMISTVQEKQKKILTTYVDLNSQELSLLELVALPTAPDKEQVALLRQRLFEAGVTLRLMDMHVVKPQPVGLQELTPPELV